MGVPCTPVSTVEVAAGPGITVSFLGGVYTVSADTTDDDLVSNYKVYATEDARDLDNPSPSSGDMASAQDIDTLWLHDGTGWIIMAEPEQSYTPAYTGVTIGASTRTGTYRRSNGFIDLSTKITMGAGFAVTGAITVGMPSGITLAERGRHAVNVGIYDSGANTILGANDGIAAGASTIALYVVNVSGTYTTLSSFTATVPITWAVGDIITVDTRLKMSTRYM
jgi:hypothetical protein